MKVVIFAGGLGTRLMEETEARPKPMVEIGGKPILWHIMKFYSFYGYNDFIICLGYKSEVIKQYFFNYFLYNSDLTIDIKSNDITIHNTNSDEFKVTLIDTGLNTNTAGRLKRVRKYLDNTPFMLTYGDGVSNVSLPELIKFHQESGKIATVTAVLPPGRFGNIVSNNEGEVIQFQEKPEGDGMWINGGFFVLNTEVFNYLEEFDDDEQWEKGPLIKLVSHGQLAAYKHFDFWKSMDALRDRIELEQLWATNNARWKIW
jgi:glucose-1-phosphate cytidylyltransferase